MKKASKLLFALGLLLISTTANSQVLISLLFGDKLNSPGLEFGLEAGWNVSFLSDMESKRPLSAFNLGFYFDILLKDQFYLNTGVLVKSKVGLAKLEQPDLDFLNATIYNEPGDYEQVLSTFFVPVLANYKFKNHFYVEAGPQVGWTHKAYVEYRSDIEGTNARIREDNEDLIQKIDGGLVAGFGYRLLKGTGVTIGIKYYHGLGNIYKDRVGTKNRSIYLKVNIPVGA